MEEIEKELYIKATTIDIEINHVFTNEFQNKIINFIIVSPNGVQQMSPSFQDLGNFF